MKRDYLVGAVRERLKRYPAPYQNHYGVVPLAPQEGPIDMRGAQADHSAAMAALGRGDAIAAQFPSHFLLSRVLVRQEAVHSSEMEGTHSTLDNLLEVEETGDVSGDEKETEAARQVRDYAVALEGALVKIGRGGAEAFSAELVQDLHASLFREASDYEDVPGALRQNVVWVGGGLDISLSRYNPAPPDNVEKCLSEQIAYLRNDGLQQQTQSMITQMAVAHAHFEAVHPFRDGNGRVGRLLLPLMLAAQGHTPLYLSPYIAAHKTDYIDALVAAQQRLDLVPLIGHLARAIVSTVDDAEKVRVQLAALQSEWEERRVFRRGSAAQRLLDLLPGHPVVTAKSAAGLLAVSGQASRTALNQLAAANILTEKTGYKRNRVYVARKILDIYRNPEGPGQTA